MIPTTEFGALRAFVAVAEASSFSRAAERLGVSPPALTQAVKALEARVGSRLLARTTRAVSLTEAGRVLLERVRPAIEELSIALDGVRPPRGRPSGTVRVHAFRIAAELFLTPMLASFARDFPEIVLDIALDDTVVDLVTGGFDVAIRVGEVIARDMVAVPIGPKLRQVAVASPAYLAEHGTPETPQDLLAHRCIRWRWPGQAVPYAWEFREESGRWFSLTVDGSLIVNARDFGVSAAVTGAGIALAIEEAVARHVSEGRLVPVLERWSGTFSGFFLCYPRHEHMAPAVKALVDRLGQA
jgi:DNA-binding transcriptional LysR family regulator